MVIDSSALLAILLDEPDASAHYYAIANSPVRLLSAATLVEASVVFMRRRTLGATDALDSVIANLRIEVISVDRQQALIAREAFRRFGKGRHPAGLNFGDCFSYALARQTGEPLLFKGNDFSKTDLLLA